MTHPWKDGARPDGSSRAQRARLVLVLLIALALPVAIVAVGSRPPEVQTLEMAGAVGAAAAPAPTTIQQWQASSSEAESTTTEDVTTRRGFTTNKRGTSRDPAVPAVWSRVHEAFVCDVRLTGAAGVDGGIGAAG